MYQISLTVQSTIGCWICRAVISDTDQFGRVTTVAVTDPSYLEVDPDEMQDELTDIFKVVERYAKILLDTP